MLGWHAQPCIINYLICSFLNNGLCSIILISVYLSVSGIASLTFHSPGKTVQLSFFNILSALGLDWCVSVHYGIFNCMLTSSSCTFSLSVTIWFQYLNFSILFYKLFFSRILLVILLVLLLVLVLCVRLHEAGVNHTTLPIKRAKHIKKMNLKLNSNVGKEMLS